MDIVTLTSFEDELRLIKMADSAPWKPPSIAPVTMAAAKKPAAWKHAPQHSKEVADGLKNLFKNYGTKALSKHGAVGMAGLGALTGAGLSLGTDAMREWDARHAENQMMKRVPPELQDAAANALKADRLHRLKRIGVKAAIGGTVGGGIGFAGGKAYEAAMRGLQGTGQSVANTLGEGFKKGISEGIPAAAAETRKNLKGSFWDLFKRK